MKNERKNLKTQAEIMRIGNLYQKQSINLMFLLEEYFLLHPEDWNPVQILTYITNFYFENHKSQSESDFPDLIHNELPVEKINLFTTYEVVLLLKSGFYSKKKSNPANLPDLNYLTTLAFHEVIKKKDFDFSFGRLEINTSINIAAEIGSTKMVELCLKNIPDPLFNDGLSLVIAAFNGNYDIMTILLSANLAVLSDIYGYNISILRAGCKMGHIGIVKFYLREINKFQVDDEEDVIDSLIFAISGGHDEICKLLISSRYYSHAKYVRYLMKAAQKGNLSVIKMLKIESEEEGFVSSNDLFYALDNACYYGHMRVVKFLKEYGLAENLQFWIFVSAIEADQFRILDYLTDNGYEINHLDAWEISYNKRATYKQTLYAFRRIVEKHPHRAKEFEWSLTSEMREKYAEWLTAGDFNMI